MDALASQRDRMVERHIAGRGVRDPAVLANPGRRGARSHFGASLVP